MVKRRLWAAGLCGHGVVHVLAFQAAWGIASLEEFSPVPAFPAVAPGSLAAHLLGALWLLAAAGFLATATLVVHAHPWWRPVAAAASLVSLGVCMLWWHDAPAGAAVDMVILGGLAAAQLPVGLLAHLRPVVRRPAALPPG